MRIVPFSVLDPATVRMLPVATESEGSCFLIAAMDCRKPRLANPPPRFPTGPKFGQLVSPLAFLAHGDQLYKECRFGKKHGKFSFLGLLPDKHLGKLEILPACRGGQVALFELPPVRL
jgi:hypothetical protein